MPTRSCRLHGVPELPCPAGDLVGFNFFPYALLMVVAVPAALAALFGWFAFRSRVTGVYLSIITQALTYALLLAFFRNDMGFGGNNGLTTQGHSRLQRAGRCDPRRPLRLSAIMLALGYVLRPRSSPRSSARCWSRSATPRAARASSATASSTTNCWSSPCRPPWRASRGPSTCRRSASSIRARCRRRPIPSRSVDLGRRSAAAARCVGPIARRLASSISARRRWSHAGAFPEFWLYFLGALFILVTIFLPQGHHRPAGSPARRTLHDPRPHGRPSMRGRCAKSRRTSPPDLQATAELTAKRAIRDR